MTYLLHQYHTVLLGEKYFNKGEQALLFNAFAYFIVFRIKDLIQRNVFSLTVGGLGPCLIRDVYVCSLLS